MKKIMLLAFVVFLSGCTALDVALDVADIFIEEEPAVHSGTVEAVHMNDNSTVVRFDDGISYGLKGRHYIKPGDKASIISTDGVLSVEKKY